MKKGERKRKRNALKTQQQQSFLLLGFVPTFFIWNSATFGWCLLCSELGPQQSQTCTRLQDWVRSVSLFPSVLEISDFLRLFLMQFVGLS